MAITITQRPSKYNLVVSPNVYTLSGLSPSEDAYVLQVEQWDEVAASSSIIATIQQPANPSGVGIFDISKILQSYMDIAFVEDTQEASPTAGEAFAYRVRYGSVTNDVPTFAVGYDAIRYVYNGYEDWRVLNWPDQTEFIPEPTISPCESQPGYNQPIFPKEYRFLHNYPNSRLPLRSSTYHTLSFFNRIGNWDNGSLWEVNEQPYAVRIRFYDVSGNLIQTAAYAISDQTGLGPRQTYASTIIDAYTKDELIGTIGVGPQNLKDSGVWPQASSALWNQVSQVWGNYQVIWNLATSSAIVDHYVVDVMSIDYCEVGASGGMPSSPSAADILPYLDQVIYSDTFQVNDPCTGYEPITVSFVNQYGVKDYFTFDRRNTYSQNIKRNNYDQMLGSWSASTFQIDQHGRGRRTFSTEIGTNMTMSSYWMGDEESAWLEELFTSPHIQVYYNGVWEPAVITSNTYSQKTNTRDGLFQHTLNIEFANTKKVQRG